MNQKEGVGVAARQAATVRKAVQIDLEWGTCPGHDNVFDCGGVCVAWCNISFQKMGHHGEKRNRRKNLI